MLRATISSTVTARAVRGWKHRIASRTTRRRMRTSRVGSELAAVSLNSGALGGGSVSRAKLARRPTGPGSREEEQMNARRIPGIMVIGIGVALGIMGCGVGEEGTSGAGSEQANQPVTGNGAPSGPHFQLNLIGVTNT